MIKAFQALEEAGAQVDPALLSGGIWEALLTTAVGLAVAIPAVALYTLFDRAHERVSSRMEHILSRCLHGSIGSTAGPVQVAPTLATSRPSR